MNTDKLSPKSDALEFWIRGGSLVPAPVSASTLTLPGKILLQNQDAVLVSADEQGTTLRWVMAGANWASLLFAKEWLGTFRGPFTFMFFSAGWYVETVENAHDARKRLDVLIAKSDLRLSSRVFTMPATAIAHKLPHSLRMAYEAGEALDEYSVLCSVDDKNQHTRVERIGANSALAKVWGMSPVSYPCLPGNNYDRIVSRPYFEVLRTGRPHYDHVCASMLQPNGEIHWKTYQRIIFPTFEMGSNALAVNVVSEVAPVDISMW